MARKFEEFHDDNKGNLVEAFKDANPDYWAKLQRSPQDIERVREILKFTDQTTEQWKEEQNETRKLRIAEEAIKIFEERTGQKPTPKSPGGVINLASESIFEEARKRIEKREQGEIETIQQDGLKAVNIAANISEQKKEKLEMSEEEKTHFKADLHKAVDDAQKARTQSRRLFFQERENLIEEAKLAGSQEPEKDVGIAQAKIMGNIDRQEHKDIHTVFETYGWERGKSAVEFQEGQETNEHNPAKDKLVKHVQDFVQDKLNKEANEQAQNQAQDHEIINDEGHEHDHTQ